MIPALLQSFSSEKAFDWPILLFLIKWNYIYFPSVYLYLSLQELCMGCLGLCVAVVPARVFPVLVRIS